MQSISSLKLSIIFLTLLVTLFMFSQNIYAQESSLSDTSKTAWKQEELKSGEAHLMTFLLNHESEVGFEFQSSDSVVYMTVIHPKSDIVVDNNQMSVVCKGVKSHPVKVSGKYRSNKATAHVRSKADRGVFTVAWNNEGPDDVVLNYRAIVLSGQFVKIKSETIPIGRIRLED